MSSHWNGGPQRCRHDIIEPHRISDTTIEYWCRSCGEVVGSSYQEGYNPDDDNGEAYITGRPRELTEEEKEKLA
jgi:uncharacterized protein YqjF (DUF2071 family)